MLRDVRLQAPASRGQSSTLGPARAAPPGLPPAALGPPGGPGALVPPPPPPPRGPPGRLPGGDPQIGHIFRNMRAAVRASREAVALRLATSVATIEDLENGAISALPHWPETVRIVRAYCELLRLDPEPLLWRLQQLLNHGVSAEEAAADRAAVAGPPPLVLRNGQSREPMVLGPPRRRRGGLRRLLILSALPAIVAGLAYLTVVAPAVGYRVIRQLPASWAEPAKNGLDAIVLYSAPHREGLKWIDVGNPRLRRGDKLQTKVR